MEPIIYIGFGAIILSGGVLLAVVIQSRRQRKRDAAKIHKILSDKEQTTTHISVKTGIPIQRVHTAVNSLAQTHGVHSRFSIGRSKIRFVSTPAVVDSSLSLTDVVIAEEILSSNSASPVVAEVPTFSGYGGGNSGGGGASDSYADSSSSDSGSSCDAGGGDS